MAANYSLGLLNPVHLHFDSLLELIKLMNNYKHLLWCNVEFKEKTILN